MIAIKNEKFFDLSSDVYFKQFFLNKHCLALFLSVLWDKKVNENDISYDNTESVYPSNKKIFYDVLASVKFEDSIKTIKINLEMQNENYYNLKTRMDYYSSRKYSELVSPNEDYDNAYLESIWFLGFNNIKTYVKDDSKWMTKYYLQNEEGCIINPDHVVRLIFLKNKENCPIMELREFLEWFDNLDVNNLPNPQGILAMEASKMLKKMNSDEALRNEAFSRELFFKDQYNKLKSAKQEGMEEGLAKGKAEGKAEGMEESKKEIVKNLHSLGQTNEFITKATNLTLEEVEKILK